MGLQQEPNRKLSLGGQPAMHKNDDGYEKQDCVDAMSSTYSKAEDSFGVSGTLQLSSLDTEDRVKICTDHVKEQGKDSNCDWPALLNPIDVRLSRYDMGQHMDMLRLRNNLQLLKLERETEETLNVCQVSRSPQSSQQFVTIRSDVLTNLAMRPERHALKMSFMRRSEMHSFVFCQQNLGLLRIPGSGSAEMVLEVWAFRHMETGEYMVVHESAKGWELGLLPIDASLDDHTSHSLSAPGLNTSRADSSVVRSSSVRSVSSDGIEQYCKFLLREETNGAVAIIPMSLRQNNKRLGYTSTNREGPVDVMDGRDANFRIKAAQPSNSRLSFKAENPSLCFQRWRKQSSSIKSAVYMLVFLERIK